MSEIRPPTAWDDYLFDLYGFLILPGAASPAQVAAMNAACDGWFADGGEWVGNVHALPPTGGTMAEYGATPESRRVQTFQSVIEAGGAFEEMIDNPAWISYVRRYVDPDGLHLWMNFLTATSGGGGTKLHSGGHSHTFRNSFDYHDGRFHCGNFVALLALTDIGPGDGPTVVVPGSHKSNIPNPRVHGNASAADLPTTLAGIDGIVKDVHLRAGDAVIFTDAILHGGRPRTNPGQRRILGFRYAPFWTKNRLGYEPSEELVARLTPERRSIVRPITPMRPPIREAQVAAKAQLASSR
jgi:hypothetical protein